MRRQSEEGPLKLHVLGCGRGCQRQEDRGEVVRGDLVVTKGRSRVPVPSGLTHALGGAGREAETRLRRAGGAMGCWATFRRELRLSNFRVTHPEPHVFLVSEWQEQPVSCVRPWYVVYRWAWALYHLCWWSASLANEGGLDASLKRKAYHFIYLTNWAYLSIVVMTAVHAGLVTDAWLRYRRTGQLPKTTTLRFKVLWVMQNVVFLPALLITAAYWSAVYNPADPITAINADVHIINSVYVLLDLCISATPVRILHFYIPFLFMTVYLVFTLIYWAAGGTTPDGFTAIYPIMDWDNLSVTLPFVVCCVIFSPFMQGLVWGVYRARVAVRERCCGGRSSLAPLPHPATMDVILGRDASMESVYARTPDPVTGQTVSLSPVTPQNVYQNPVSPQTQYQPHNNTQQAPVTQSV
ncbi:protein rolling stone-like isoform X2 [Eriocheir sinensis]|uniref:protein rolling stone-like isoform X2 n=1 Tax=Eriocheir sinensis TaxID=95602 RepID=UPI0021CA89AB|nr:protein rolling stone-like isoform X2 [Eriocheir sinensis]